MFSVGIVGGTGYTGGELLRILGPHPDLEVRCVTSRGNCGRPVAGVWPNLSASLDLKFSEPSAEALAQCQLVFFATPHGTAMEMAPYLLEKGVKVVDLSADFRLRSVPEWEFWYQRTHTCPALIESAVYGLPEVNREAIRATQLVANPGCYPVAVSLALLPLIEARCIDFSDIIADAKSGVSGAGRSATVDKLHGEIAESFKAYGVHGHRHFPEIVQILEGLCGERIGLTFVPHLLPMFRGMHATIYTRVTQRDCDVMALFRARYEDHPFVLIEEQLDHPDTRTVRGSNFCRIAAHRLDGSDRLVVLSVIDNLTKGAAGLAVQNANLMLGLDETAGLQLPALYP